MPDTSAITRIVQQLGGTFGIALAGVVLTAATSATHPEAGFSAAFWFIIAVTVAAAIVALALPHKPLPGKGKQIGLSTEKPPQNG